MGEPKAEKIAIVAEVREKFQSSEAVVLTEYRGLNVTDMAALRNAMRDAGGEYKVYKNSLVRFAARELDLDIEELLVGPTAIAFTGTRPDGGDADVVTVAKALTDFSKDNESLVIKGGMLDGTLLTVDEIISLSKIAPREELLAKLAGGMAAPIQQLAGLIKAVPQKFAYALSALIEAEGGSQDSVDSVSAEESAETQGIEEETSEEETSEEETSEEETSEEETEIEEDNENENTGESSNEEEN